MIEMPE